MIRACAWASSAAAEPAESAATAILDPEFVLEALQQPRVALCSDTRKSQGGRDRKEHPSRLEVIYLKREQEASRMTQ